VLSRDPQYLTDQANGIPSYGNWHHRTDQLRDIHEHQVSMFINAPGFGVTRMMIHRSPWNLLSSGPSDVIVPQPESPLLRPSPPEADRIPANALTSKHDAMRGLHINAVTDFGDPFLTGYIRDREHVAGFIPHRLVELPAPSILAVELVGLLEHPEPVVYVSENLPRMDELRNAPTRPLDGFENAALERILKGDDIITATTPDGSRMLGAIRALKSCLLCHDAEYGDLLGAFSYRLNKER
jgi:hypothetical protein